MAQQKLQGKNWTPGCDFPPEINADKGIEGVPASMLHALVNQFMDATRPLTFQKVDDVATQRGKLFNSNIINTI